jgi:hypothetical protein
MPLSDLLRPRVALTTGAALLLAVPLAILAGAGVVLAVVAARRDKPLRDLLVAGAKIAADAESRVRALDELLTGLDDIGGMVASAKRVLHRAEAGASADAASRKSPPPDEPAAQKAAEPTPSPVANGAAT